MAQDLELQIKAKDEASTTIDKVSDSVDKLGKTSGESKGFVAAMWKEMAAGMTVANLATKAVDFLTKTVKESISAYVEQERQESRLKTVMTSRNEDVKKMTDSIDEFAESMKFLTGVDDDQIKSLEILARQYGIQSDKIDETIKKTIGLTEIGGDYESNLKALANAYEGNWRQLTQLLPELRSVKNETEKWDIVNRAAATGLRTVTEEMKTSSGQLKELSNWWEDGKKKLGNFIVTAVKGLDAMNGYRRMMIDYAREEISTSQSLLTVSQNIVDSSKRRYESYGKLATSGKVLIDVEADLTSGYSDNYEANQKIIKSLEEANKKIEERKIAAREAAEADEYWKRVMAAMPRVSTTAEQSVENLNKATEEQNNKLRELCEQYLIWLGVIPEFNGQQEKATEKTKKWSINWKDANDVLDFSKNIISGITDILSSLGVELDDTAKSLLGLAESAGSLITGLISHNPAQIIQGVVGAISSLISLFKGHGVEQAIQRENAWMKLTKEQIEQIKELEKQYGSTHAATSELLDSFISSADITTDSFDQWTYRVREILSDLDQGKMTLAQTQKQIGDAFSSLIEKAKELGTEGSKSLITFFDDLASRGIKVAEVQEYIQEQLAKGLEGYIAMKAAMEDNADATEAFGNINVEVYEEMIRYQNLVEQNKGLVNAIEGAEKALTSLSNTQKLTEEQFDSFATSASLSYEKLIEGGMNSSQALQTLTPYLQRLQFLHEQYGYTIDENTQKIIDQAIAEGRVVENKKTETQQIIGLLESIAEVLGAKIPKSLNETGEAATRAFDKAANGAYNFGRALDEVSRERDVYVTTHYNSEGEIPAAKGFQGWVSKPTRFLVGEAGPEFVSVTPRSRIGKGGKGGEISVSQNITINGVNLDKASLIEAIKTAIPNNTQGLKTIIQKAIAEA